MSSAFRIAALLGAAGAGVPESDDDGPLATELMGSVDDWAGAPGRGWV